MMGKHILVVVIAMVMMVVVVVQSQQATSEITNRIYTDLPYSYPCTRLLDANGQIGCTSKIGGNAGILYLIDSDSTLNDFINTHHEDPVIPTLDANYFNTSILDKLETKTIQGVLVLTDTKQSYAYSPEMNNPNRQYGLYPQSQFNWNPVGDGLTYREFQYPMFALGQNDSMVARQYATSNQDGSYPKWGIEMMSFMHGAIDAQTCLRRGFCVPVGGQSSWATFNDYIDPSQDIMLVIVPQDATAFFRDMAMGAESTTYGSLVLLTLINTLASIDKSDWNVQVVFAMFQAERWGYIGSTKFVYDLLNFKCESYANDQHTACSIPYYPDLSFTNITFPRIKTILELNQIGNPKTITNQQYMFAMHQTIPSASPSPLRDSMLQTAGNLKLSVGLQSSQMSELPPSSTMAFLKQQSSIDHVVVTDHFNAYTNGYYGSHNDISSNTNQQILVDTVTLFASIINQFASSGNNTSPIEVDQNFLNNLYSCLLTEFDCDWVEVLLSFYPYNTYPSFYTSVFGNSPQYQLSTLQAQLYHNLLAVLTTPTNMTTAPVCKENSDCSDGTICIQSHCIVSRSHSHEAISLAFDFDEKSYSYFIADSNYPTFVESNWDYTNLRYFKQDKKSSEIIFLIFGILEMFVTIGIIFYSRRFLSKRYKLL